ncbi:hypothetical protein AML91_09495 [Paenibacillus jilunlii]|uniref:Uncharacterized protein n=1 Tax=Paenibacillus jilunlii TaxID=682956 RepID=A0ABR5SWR0_9BACL|nr:hypothetical protein AML91_09495 [Paenibacillus jilunlii]
MFGISALQNPLLANDGTPAGVKDGNPDYMKAQTVLFSPRSPSLYKPSRKLYLFFSWAGVDILSNEPEMAAQLSVMGARR